MDVTQMSLHPHTPQLQVIDPRALLVREVAYCRGVENGEAEQRVTRHTWDEGGRPVADWDPRLWANGLPANTNVIRSLSGQVLLNESADAGWRVSLPGAAGQQVEVCDGRGNCCLTEYDELLRKVCVTESLAEQPFRAVERFAYGDASGASALHNQCGQLIRHDDPAGTRSVSDVGLGGAALVEKRRFLNDAQTVDWPLDAAQRDSCLEPGPGYSTLQTCDATFVSIRQTDATGNLSTHFFGVDGLLKETRFTLAESANTQSLISEIRYNAEVQALSERLGNGVVTENSYESATGRLIRIYASKADGLTLQDLNYQYDAVGNVVAIEDLAQPTRYSSNQKIEPVSRYRYDSLYQLIEATGREVSTGASHGPALPELKNLPLDANQLSNYTQTFDYDAGGNLLHLRHVGAQSFTRNMRVAPNSNRSLSDDHSEGDFENGFDANGNLQQLARGQSLKWDLRNQLNRVTAVQHEDGSEDDEVYVYDSAGQRCRKICTAQAGNRTLMAEVRYLPALEVRSEPNGELLHVATVQAGRSSVRVLHWQQGKPDGIDNDQVRYSLNDHLGSCSLELDDKGALISQEGYYPFGATAWWAASSAVEAKYKTVRYSGKERDATGLYYYGFRYYAPWLMRWVNPDPERSIDGLNLFRFVHNRPCTLIDIHGTVGDTPAFKELQERLMKLVDMSPQAYEFITASYEHDISGHEILSTYKQPDYTGCESDHFENHFYPHEWILKYNFKNRENGHPLTHANQVTLAQYITISEKEGFFGELPALIKRTNISNEGVKAVANLYSMHPAALKDAFLNETQNGRSTARILNDFGLTASRVEAVTGEYGDLDIHIFVHPIGSELSATVESSTHTDEHRITQASRFTVIPAVPAPPEPAVGPSTRASSRFTVSPSRFNVTPVPKNRPHLATRRSSGGL